MRAFLIVLALALALPVFPGTAGPPSPDMPETLKGFRWATRDPKTGQITMILAGREAVADPKGGPIDVIGPTISFFDRLQAGPGFRPAVPSTTVITGQKARYHRDSGLLSLQGKVVVTRSDGTVLRTETLEWDDTAGRFWTQAPAEVTDGSSLISGAGLKGEMSENPEGRMMDRITLAKDVRTVLNGAQLAGLDDLFEEGAARSSGPSGVTITCGGSMVYQRRAGVIDYTEGVSARDALRTLESRSLSLVLGQDRRIARMEATGHVRAGGPRGAEATGDSFRWDAATSRASLSGAPYVRVKRPGGTIRAAGVLHDRTSGLTSFAGPGVVALAPPKKKPEPPHAP